MEQWEIDFNWLKIQHFVKDSFGQSALPNLETILFIIGYQELGMVKEEYSKKDKLEFVYLGVCKLLSLGGFMKFEGKDSEGWPIWKEINKFEPKNEQIRKNELKKYVIEYFENNYDIEHYTQKD